MHNTISVYRFRDPSGKSFAWIELFTDNTIYTVNVYMLSISVPVEIYKSKDYSKAKEKYNELKEKYSEMGRAIL